MKQLKRNPACLLRRSGPFWVPQGRRCVWGIKRPFWLFIIPKTCPGVQGGETKYVQFQLMFIFIRPLKTGPPWVLSNKHAKLRVW